LKVLFYYYSVVVRVVSVVFVSENRVDEREREREFERERETLYKLERERETISRLRERRWLDTAFREECSARIDRERQQPTDASRKQNTSPANPIAFGEELQFWPDKNGGHAQFTHMAALHSELLAVNKNGQLCQWRWTDPEPYSSSEVRDSRIFYLDIDY
jgi:hypothetical protein